MRDITTIRWELLVKGDAAGSQEGTTMKIQKLNVFAVIESQAQPVA
jgi:hypothetical protein